MLSRRGQEYAQSGLYGQYDRKKAEPYKKHTNPSGEINFQNAQNYPMATRLTEYLNTHFKFSESHLDYNEGAIGTTRIRNAMASHLNDYFSPFSPITSGHITFTPGVTGLNEMFAFALADQNEGILMGTPIYGSFHTDLVTKSGVKLVYAKFGGLEQFGVECVAKYEEALLQAAKDGVKVKVLLICNPHNPLGRCYPKETLIALMGLCEKYGIHLVSDEIYGLSTFEVEGRREIGFTSVLSLDPNGVIKTDLVHVLYGMSKDFCAAGLRLGCIITQNKEMNQAIRAISRFHWPSEISGAVAISILEDKQFVASYLQESREVLAKGYILATKALDEAGIRYSPHANAGFFIWLDLSPYLGGNKDWEAEKALKEKLESNDVYLSSGFAYKEERPGWFRLIFSRDEYTVEEGLKRIISLTRSLCLETPQI